MAIYSLVGRNKPSWTTRQLLREPDQYGQQTGSTIKVSLQGGLEVLFAFISCIRRQMQKTNLPLTGKRLTRSQYIRIAPAHNPFLIDLADILYRFILS